MNDSRNIMCESESDSINRWRILSEDIEWRVVIECTSSRSITFGFVISSLFCLLCITVVLQLLALLIGGTIRLKVTRQVSNLTTSE